MRKLKILPKIFLQIFIIINILIIVIHLSVYVIFPKSYLETRKHEVDIKADEIALSMNGKDLKFVMQALEFYSNNSEIKAYIKGMKSDKSVKVEEDIDVDYYSDENSVILEERDIKLKDGKKITLQFVSSENMQEDAKHLTLSFLPYSILVSVLFSMIVSYIFARSISKNVNEIVAVSERMANLDRDARIEIKSEDEIGHLKKQLNMLYETLLGLIDDLEEKNEEITRLSKLRYDFFRGRSHELKTPLASLKIVLENMVDELNHSISQTLSISSYDQQRNDEEMLVIKDLISDVEKKYSAHIEKKNLHLDIKLGDEKLYIGRTALKIVLSNLMSNATKYNVNGGKINIGVKDGWLYVENTGENLGELNLDRIFEIGFSLDKENGNGIGLYVVSNILINYGIEHKIEMNGDRFIFLIKLNA